MKTKYKINKNELIINIDFLYEILEKPKNLKTIYYYLNKIIKKENIRFVGNKIILYINGILIGTMYLTSFYLKRINFFLNNFELNEKNSYFLYNNIIEIFPYSKKIKTKKILNY